MATQVQTNRTGIMLSITPKQRLHNQLADDINQVLLYIGRHRLCFKTQLYRVSPARQYTLNCLAEDRLRIITQPDTLNEDFLKQILSNVYSLIPNSHALHTPALCSLYTNIKLTIKKLS